MGNQSVFIIYMPVIDRQGTDEHTQFLSPFPTYPCMGDQTLEREGVVNGTQLIKIL